MTALQATAQKDWSKMSANEKIKLAKKEQKAAKKDPAYLALMNEALSLFQAGKMEEAKVKYTEAHELRPDNVYPMVMLDDIEIAMNMPIVESQEEKIEEEIVTEEIAIETLDEEIFEEENQIEAEEIAIEEEEVAEETEVLEITEEDSEIIVRDEPEMKIKKDAKLVVTPETVTINHPPKVYEKDGVYKESFKEGSANVEQVTIVEKNVATIYRKVSHSWGAIYYFQDGEAITKAEWDKMLTEIAKN
jgi:tetratricopeptide (TPR) repeat protein